MDTWNEIVCKRARTLIQPFESCLLCIYDMCFEIIMPCMFIFIRQQHMHVFIMSVILRFGHAATQLQQLPRSHVWRCSRVGVFGLLFACVKLLFPIFVDDLPMKTAIDGEFPPRHPVTPRQELRRDMRTRNCWFMRRRTGPRLDVNPSYRWEHFFRENLQEVLFLVQNLGLSCKFVDRFFH